MQADQIEPLELTLWLARVRQVSDWPREGSGALEKALRHSFHLVQLAPRQLRPFVRCTLAEAEFEAKLEAGAQLSAAMSLICDARSGTVGVAQLGRDARAATVFGRWLSKVVTLSESAPARELTSSEEETSPGHLRIVASSSRSSVSSAA